MVHPDLRNITKRAPVTQRHGIQYILTPCPLFCALGWNLFLTSPNSAGPSRLSPTQLERFLGQPKETHCSNYSRVI